MPVAVAVTVTLHNHKTDYPKLRRHLAKKHDWGIVRVNQFDHFDEPEESQTAGKQVYMYAYKGNPNIVAEPGQDYGRRSFIVSLFALGIAMIDAGINGYQASTNDDPGRGQILQEKNTTTVIYEQTIIYQKDSCTLQDLRREITKLKAKK